MRIENSNVLKKNIRSIIENLESLCKYFNMEANIHLSKSGDSGYIDAFTEKSLTSFEADINSDVLLMTLYEEDGDTIRWRIYSTDKCLDEFKKDYLDLRIELQKLRSKGHI